jgi:hypothetical protein
MRKKPLQKPAKSQLSPDPMEGAKRIMRRLAEMPPKPHQPLGVRPKHKERPASKGIKAAADC